VRTADEMADAVLAACQEADALVMAAAVADFRPAEAAAQKIKKERGLPALPLEPTRDILVAVAQQREKTGRPQVVAGFAAETRDLLAHARAKLEAKKLDLMIANDVSAADAGFAVDTNRVTLLDADGAAESLPLLPKAEVAQKVVAKLAALLNREARP
jgi:phosphopantothenoylcysteine decarboxylase/phosphopantothenate--cysteine ligase